MLLVLTSISMILYANQHSIPDGVHINQINVEHQSVSQILAQMKQLEAHWKTYTFTFVYENEASQQVTYTGEELGIHTNLSSIATSLLDLERGTIWNKFWTRLHMRHRTYDIHMDVDHATLQSKLTQHFSFIQNNEPTNAVRTITDYDTITYTPEKNVARIDFEQLNINVQKEIQMQLQQWQDFKQNGITMKLPMYVLEAGVTVHKLKNQGVSKKIGQFTTTFRSSAGRVHNIHSVAKTMDTMLLKPQEIFSYEEVIKSAEKKYGFKQASVIVNGKFVPGIGGGICQVSTTLYNAILRSGLEVVERRNHSVPIRYVPLGQDATFSRGNINFRFRNNTNHHLLIHTEISNQHVTVKLFGTEINENHSYIVSSKLTKVLPPPKKVVYNPKLPVGTEKVLQKGKSGFIVETKRITTENGKMIKEEIISTDTYPPTPMLVATKKNSTPEPRSQIAPKRNIIEDGVEGPIFYFQPDE